MNKFFDEEIRYQIESSEIWENPSDELIAIYGVSSSDDTPQKEEK